MPGFFKVADRSCFDYVGFSKSIRQRGDWVCLHRSWPPVFGPVPSIILADLLSLSQQQERVDSDGWLAAPIRFLARSAGVGTSAVIAGLQSLRNRGAVEVRSTPDGGQ